jgi:nitrite reductase/ring-hydroxylating ferredoxin subunit
VTIDTGFAPAPRTPDAIGEVTVFDVEGTAVALANVDGTLYAFDDTCSHRACPLSEGAIDGPIVTCPCHKSRFDLRTGDVLNGPATVPIRVRRVFHDGGQVLVQR